MYLTLKLYLYLYTNKMIKLKQSGPICSYNNQAYQVCLNPDCQTNPFICNCQNKCQCESHHLQCDKINWQYIKNKLNSNIVKNNPQFQSFSNTVQSLYQSVIKQITKSYNDFKLWRDHFGLTQKESQFFKLIEEGRYDKMTGQSIYEIRKQIKLPSKILLKDESDIKKEIQMINTYAQSILLQFSELYSKNKVEKINLVQNSENKRVNVQMSEQNKQLKLNLAHKLLGLNQKGSKFLTMLNEGIIETKLQNLTQKVLSNQVSIKTVDLRIEKLTQTISDHKNEMKTENSQLKKEIKNDISQFKDQITQQNNEMKKQVTDMKKEATQFRKQNKQEYLNIKNYGETLKQQIIIKTKINNTKLKVISNLQLAFAFTKKQFPFLTQQSLKNKSAESLNKIEQKIPSILKYHLDNKLAVEKLRQKFISIQKQAQLIRRQFDFIGNQNKINAISYLFAKKIVQLDLLYRASQNNFQDQIFDYYQFIRIKLVCNL